MNRGVGKSVLIVDDNAVIRRTIAAAFRAEGYQAFADAENGKEAVALAAKTRPDLITADLSMPVMNGLQASREMRKLLPETPIILFTLYGDSVPQAEAADAGINMVLSKTTPLDVLLTKAHELIARVARENESTSH